MTTELGRPRDRRIDSDVLRATAELLGETGYADLSVDAIARRAGTRIACNPAARASALPS